MAKLISINETGNVQSLAVLPDTDVTDFTTANSGVEYIEIPENIAIKAGDHYNIDTGVVTPVQTTSVFTPIVSSKVSPVEFKLLFTIQERLAMRTARTTDPVIEDFFDLIEDPRLTHVDLSIPPVIEMMNYLETNGVISEGRAAVILASPGSV